MRYDIVPRSLILTCSNMKAKLIIAWTKKKIRFVVV